MSDAIKKLHDYLAKSPSVVYPEDVLAYLPAIEAENSKLRQELEVVGTAAYLYGRTDLADENAKLREYAKSLEAANLDVTSRLQDYIGQYDPTDVYVVEAKAENARLRTQLADVTESMGRVEERCAKLQELIKYVISRYNDINREYWGNQEPLPCDLCNMERQCSEVPQRERCLFYEHLRELGIEASK